jgi:hypothetical protein
MAPQVAQRIKELIPRDSNRQAQPHTIMAAAVGLMKLSHEESVKWALQYDGSVLNAWAVSLPGPLNQAQLMNLVLESAQAEAEEEMMERFVDLMEEEQAMMEEYEGYEDFEVEHELACFQWGEVNVQILKQILSLLK